MALSLTEIQSLSDNVWMPGSANNWQMGNALWFKLYNAMQTAPSGLKVRQVIEYAKANGGPMGASTMFDTTKKVIHNAADYDWAMFYSNVTYDIDDEVMISGGESGVDLIMSKLDNAQSTIRDLAGDSMNTLYSTMLTSYPNTRPFYGVPDLMNATGSFGGIAYTDLGTFTNAGTEASQYIWASYSDDTPYTMGFDTLQILSRCTRVGGDNTKEVIDLIITTPKLKDAFEAEQAPQQIHQDPALLQAGFDTINFRTSCPVVADDKAPANYVRGYNMDKLLLRPHQDFNFTQPVWKEPTNQYVKTCQIKLVAAFCAKSRRAHGQLTNVSV